MGKSTISMAIFNSELLGVTREYMVHMLKRNLWVQS